MLPFDNPANDWIFQKTLNCLPDPVLIVNTNQRITYANLAATRLCGVDLIGQLIVAALRHPNALESLTSVAEQKIALNTQITISKNGVETSFKFSATPILNEDQSLNAIIVTLQDSSDIDEAEQIRRTFVANVSHELRSPLAALISCSETLKKTNQDGDGPQSMIIELMEREIKRMNRLVSELLSLSKVEANERIRPTSRVDISEILTTVVETYKVIAEKNLVDIQLKIDSDVWPIIGDADQLNQVFRNLVDNAIKYGKTDGTIEIICHNQKTKSDFSKREVVVKVTDQGKGIAPNHIPRLTERFYRVDDHRSKNVGGAGLGLAIVKHIVQRHRGRMTITSQFGKGSVFHISLPAENE